MDPLIELLKSVKFTESEAKVYTALLQADGCSGYEASRLSGVARSKIYTILDSLERRGVLVTSTQENATFYCAVPMKQLTQSIRRGTEVTLSQMEELSRRLPCQKNERIWHLDHYEGILSKCQDMVREAKESILMQIWTEDLTNELAEELNDKMESVSKVLVILYDAKARYQTSLKKFYRHGFEEAKLQDFGHRWITIIKDQEEMLHASIHSAERSQSIYTQNSSMVFFAREYVIHDAYCLRLIQRLEKDARKEFGAHMEGVRDIFSF